MSLNNVSVMGRLTADPELRHTGNNTSVTSFTLAVERDFKNANGEKETDFLNCVAWRQTAEFITRYFSKGRMMVASGSLQTRNYEDKNGNKRQATEIVVGQAYFADSKSTLEKAENLSQAHTGQVIDINAPFEDVDDLPF